MAFRLITARVGSMSACSRRLSSSLRSPTTSLSSAASSPKDGSSPAQRVLVNHNSTLSKEKKTVAPPMVYISGEEMTNYTSELIVDKWIKPYFDIKNWETFDLSCKNRDETDDAVLHDAVDAGKRIGAIFKEPTITPSAVQVEEMGLSKALGSPNGAMRKGWNGITISRDTIHIEGVELGYKNPVLFERHAVGGEYGAGWNTVGKGTMVTTFLPKCGGEPFIVDSRELKDEENVGVVYHNPYDNVEDLAHIFFKRCLEQKVIPYVVTKKTVFKWQERFWTVMKQVFDDKYKNDFVAAGLLDATGGELSHLISDAATMQLIRWTDGGFGMAAHNYDGDMLTDEVAQIHRSPGFITSNLVGKSDDGTMIKEFEASHGTVSDMWADHLAGKETSLNPLGLVEAMIGAMQHSAKLQYDATPASPEAKQTYEKIMNFTVTLREAMHNTFRYGQGTRDMSGPSGYTTEDFIEKVAWRVERYLSAQYEEKIPELPEPDRHFKKDYDVDKESLRKLFKKYDVDGSGRLSISEMEKMLDHLGVAPRKQKFEKEPDV
eukprot:CAMPEP_0195525266 /NCGR_PEP_ID=MMETSP0794_2-20130614/25620_1 /TAXON_ID=515487 /ORGANISM="Stephanopyxis turris, Strain CCMP 815" /LENGTH=546 /DNA_ID=CAMNT_0040655689 /DNA_START=33 /DNA_END=1673 /DNA_ORIENTATION=-